MGANLILPAGSAAADSTTADPVTRSLRLDGSAYLSRSTGSTSTTWTLAFWVKRATISGPSQHQYLATWAISGSTGEGLVFRGTSDSSNTDKLMLWNGSTSTYSSGVYRDPASWAHICISVNSGTATVYYNGESILSSISGVQAWGSMRLGAWLNQNELEGYIADVYGVEGAALDHTSFTTSNDYGGIKPAIYSGALGTNGFHLLFENTSSIGEDDAGSNDFSTSGLASTDIRTDVPTDSFCVLSPIDKGSGVTLSEGNLKAVCDTNWDNVRGTVGSTSGKFYYEVIGNIGASTRWNAGIDINQKCQVDTYNSNTGSIVYALYDGVIYNGTGSAGGSGNFNSSYYVSATQDQSETNARIGVAVDIDAGKVWFRFNNGSWENSGGDPTSASSSGTITFTANSLVQPLFAGYGGTFTVYFQESEWTDTAPTDYGEWKTSRIADPTVTPSENFNTVLYTGTRDNNASVGSTSNAVTGVGFKPELLWIKDRDNASSSYGSGYYGHFLFDAVQGTGNAINIDGGMYTGSNDFSSNLDGYNGVSSFDSDGFTVDEAEAVNYAYDSDYNGSLDGYERYVAWGWKLGSNGSSSTWASGNTDPTTEKYNASAGVSVIRQEETSGNYPMTGVTVNHSLGAAPEFAFVKDTIGNTQNVYAWHKDLDANKYFRLNATSAQTTGSGYFPSGCSTATTFQIGGDIAGSNSYDGYWDIYLYLFSGVEGYSKFGKYTGGSDPFIYTGFRVGFWMVKRIDSNGHWTLFDSTRDTHNLVDHQLEPNYSFAESTNSTKGGDFLSNGFKVRSSQNEVDASGGTYVYAAFAESPFSKSNAR